MEATDGTAGNADEHDGEDGQCNRIGMRVLQSVPYLRQCRMVDVKHYQNTDRHEQQGNGEQRVYLTDNLIYRQQSGKDIISENNNNPEGGIQAVGGQLGKQSGRSCHKDSSHQYHQDDGKAAHHLLGGQPQIASDDFRQAFPVMPQGEHTGKIVVHCTGKDTAKYNPQIGCRTELSSHDGTEDRSQPGNIEKLYHKDFPSRQWNVIHTIGFGKGGCFAVIGTKDAFYEASVDKIAGYQRQQAKRKCNHGVLISLMYANVTVSK